MRRKSQIGFAIQLCLLRYPGHGLSLDAVLPPALVQWVARQLRIDFACWSQYAERAETRREHLLELRSYLGLTPFGLSHFRQAVHALTELALQTDKSMVLATEALNTLRDQHIIIPALDVIERICAKAVTFANRRTHEHPFDLLRVTVTDKKGKPVYKRPLWLMIAGAKRGDVTSKEAYMSYGQRYDIEHFFRFGKQRLGLVNSQTRETRHEENWHWIGLLAYNMLYHARQLTQPVVYPWEKRKVHVIVTTQRPSQVQRDYGRIIRGIGTPASVPKPRGKSPGRSQGYKSGERQDQALILKSSTNKKTDSLDDSALLQEESLSAIPKKAPKPPRKPRQQYVRMKRVWAKNRAPSKKKERLIRIYLN